VVVATKDARWWRGSGCQGVVGTPDDELQWTLMMTGEAPGQPRDRIASGWHRGSLWAWNRKWVAPGATHFGDGLLRDHTPGGAVST